MLTRFDLNQYDYPMEYVFEGEDFLEITLATIERQSRWTTHYMQILQHKATGDFWKAQWGCGSTESQEVDPDLTLTLVQPVEITKVEYRPVYKTDKV